MKVWQDRWMDLGCRESRKRCVRIINHFDKWVITVSRDMWRNKSKRSRDVGYRAARPKYSYEGKKSCVWVCLCVCPTKTCKEEWQAADFSCPNLWMPGDGWMDGWNVLDEWIFKKRSFIIPNRKLFSQAYYATFFFRAKIVLYRLLRHSVCPIFNTQSAYIAPRNTYFVLQTHGIHQN